MQEKQKALRDPDAIYTASFKATIAKVFQQ